MTISEFSKRCGVRPETVRRWENAGKVTPIRTGGRHRRYTEANLRQSLDMLSSESVRTQFMNMKSNETIMLQPATMHSSEATMPQSVTVDSNEAIMPQLVNVNSSEATMPQTERVVIYCRTSPHERGQLENQISVLHMFSLWQGYYGVELIAEVADGTDMQRPKLLSLIKRIINGKIDRLIVAHKDRLVPFGFELIEYIAETCGCNITVLDQVSVP